MLGRTIKKSEQRQLFGSPGTARGVVEQARKDATARWEAGTAAHLQAKLAAEANKMKVRVPTDLPPTSPPDRVVHTHRAHRTHCIIRNAPICSFFSLRAWQNN